MNTCPECESKLEASVCSCCGWFDEDAWCKTHGEEISDDQLCKMCLHDANEDYLYSTWKDQRAS